MPNDSEADADAGGSGGGGGGSSSRGAGDYSGLREEHVVKASALLRLYCALMGIAGLR